ncbi:MAG TPA: HAD family hydrolase [Stenomitos sp.]
MGMLKAVILDVDGTLVDSNGAHAESWADVFRAYGYAVTADQIRPLIGMGGDQLIPKAIGVEKESPLGKAINARRKQIFLEQYLPNLKPLPGARQLLERMRERGLRLVVATSAEAEELDRLLRVAGLEDLVEARTDAKGVPHSKPAPDVVEAALDRVGVKPDEAVMLGDTPYDLASATRAGVPMIGVKTGGYDEAGLPGAIAVYATPLDLWEHYDASPLASST